MLGLIVATTVVAMRESKARQAAIKKMKPTAAAGESMSPIATADDGFGHQDPLDAFGGSEATFDEEAFK